MWLAKPDTSRLLACRRRFAAAAVRRRDVACRRRSKSRSAAVLVADQRRRGTGRRTVFGRADLRRHRHRRGEGRAGPGRSSNRPPCSCAVRSRWAERTTRTSQPTIADSSSTTTALRLINEDVFGKDVALPELKITYRVRTQVNGAGARGHGADATCCRRCRCACCRSCRPTPTDIRDATAEHVRRHRGRLFRANAADDASAASSSASAPSSRCVAWRGGCPLPREARRPRPAGDATPTSSAACAPSWRESRRARQRAAGRRSSPARLLTALRVAGRACNVEARRRTTGGRRP